jgi:hypothetical protein
MSSLPTDGGYAGPAWVLTPSSDFNALTFLVRQIIAGKAFAALVQVKSVTGGGVSAVPPRVSVQPMVNQIDGFGIQTPHGEVYNLPCFRLQGGNGAVVLDPVVGDVGQAIICDRDISNVKATAAVGGPGSFRQNDWADGCYFGGFLNASPTTYVAFGADSLSLVTPTASIVISGGTIATTGTLTNNGHLVGNTHVHGGVQTGGGNSGPPT